VKGNNLEAPIPTSCPICTQSDGFRNTGVRVAGGHIHVCRECSGYFLYPPAHVEYQGSNWGQRREKTWSRDIQRGYRFARAICESIENELGHPVRHVLEIGCGSAFMGVGFESMGCSYTGIDVDPKAIAFAQSKSLNAHCIAAETIGDSAISDRTFDLIISSNTFEHFREPLVAFKSLTAISKGIIVVIVPNPNGLFATMKSSRLFLRLSQIYNRDKRNIVHTIDGNWHNIAYAQQTLEYLAEKAGLEVQKVEPIGTSDPVFGFVQPHYSLSYRIASGFARLLGMDAQLILFARR
jgi:SAM-dependent methyltransferase